MSAEIIPWPKHVCYKCAPDCNDGHGCMICRGGLFQCVVCGGAEGSLPTDCPGERISHAHTHAILQGDLDFRFGEGWVRADNARGTPAWKKKERNT